MPIYEYQCNACHTRHEFIQKVSDPAMTTCPSCQQDALKRLISPAGFQLKGTGWYVTDFRDKKKPEEKNKTPETTPKEKDTPTSPEKTAKKEKKET